MTTTPKLPPAIATHFPANWDDLRKMLHEYGATCYAAGREAGIDATSALAADLCGDGMALMLDELKDRE